MTKTTTWVIAGGQRITVETDKINTETEEEWQARHDALVREMQEQFPPV